MTATGLGELRRPFGLGSRPLNGVLKFTHSLQPTRSAKPLTGKHIAAESFSCGRVGAISMSCWYYGRVVVARVLPHARDEPYEFSFLE
jgi:hypothetical protein